MNVNGLKSLFVKALKSGTVVSSDIWRERWGV